MGARADSATSHHTARVGAWSRISVLPVRRVSARWLQRHPEKVIIFGAPRASFLHSPFPALSRVRRQCRGGLGTLISCDFGIVIQAPSKSRMSKFHDVEIANSQIQQKSWNREFDGSNSEPGNRNPSLSMTLKFPDSIKSRGIGNLRLKLGNWEL
jgi:hypothetical protein